MLQMPHLKSTVANSSSRTRFLFAHSRSCRTFIVFFDICLLFWLIGLCLYYTPYLPVLHFFRVLVNICPPFPESNQLSLRLPFLCPMFQGQPYQCCADLNTNHGVYSISLRFVMNSHRVPNDEIMYAIIELSSIFSMRL